MKIVIASAKGGVAKSTLATNLSTYFAQNELRTKLLDADPQATSKSWADRRRESFPEAPVVYCSQTPAGDISHPLVDEAETPDIVVCDMPGGVSTEMVKAIRKADLLLIPVRPSRADLETLEAMVTIVEPLLAARPDFRAAVVLTMVSNHNLNTEQRDAREYIESLDSGLVLCQSVIHDRKMYRDAMNLGQGVTELTGPARAELEALAEEVFSL